MDNYRVLIVDDHQIVRQGIRHQLECDSRFSVSGEAGSGKAALHLFRKLRPEVVVLDFKLPDTTGDHLCREFLKISPGTVVVILTAYFDDNTLRACLRAGAKGYLTKDCEQLNLPEQLMSLVQGHTALDPRATDVLAGFIRNEGGDRKILSRRQLEIVRLIAQGQTNKEIALQLGITENTVKGYVREIFSKLDVRNRVEAVIQARRQGILSP